MVQEYVAPYLVRGYKTSVRIYALVPSINPLQAFISQHGMLAFGSEKYQPPDRQGEDGKPTLP